MLDAGATLSYDQVYLASQTAKSAGKLKLAAGGLGWKEGATGQVTTLPAADFRSMVWMRAMRGFELRIYLKDGSVQKFDGLPEEALAELQVFAKENYQLPLEPLELAVKGWNWGRADIEGNHLEFDVNGKLAFDLPLTQVANAAVTAKNELAIEFSQPEQVDKKTDTLVEIRLYIPGAKDEEDDQDEQEGGADREDAVDDLPVDAAKSLCEKIKGFSQLSQASGETIVSLPELPCIVPRGRFQMDMAPSHLRLHGKSYDHKILYTSIVKLFLLPKADDMHVLFVLALDPPVRQGQTRYPFLVFQFNKDDEVEANLQNIDEETLKGKYEGKLQMHYNAPTFEVVSTLFRLLAGQKIIVPGSFKSQADTNCLKCALKANEGFLYPLERNFLFLPKPVTLIPHSDIAYIEFSRMGSGMGNPRSFDVKFSLKSGQEVSLSNIAKEEYQRLEDFLTQKGLEFRSKKEETRQKKTTTTNYDSEEEPAKRARDADEDESSPDEDYQGGDSDDSSVGEEYNEDYESSDDGSDGDDGKGEKKAANRGTDDDGIGSAEDEDDQEDDDEEDEDDDEEDDDDN